jgi:type I site-specific restriction endonuclease
MEYSHQRAVADGVNVNYDAASTGSVKGSQVKLAHY